MELLLSDVYMQINGGFEYLIGQWCDPNVCGQCCCFTCLGAKS
jgi:hypothetical protein